MLRRVRFLLSIVVIILFVVVLVLSSTRHIVTLKLQDNRPVAMVASKYQDSDCGMVIDSLEYSSQVISPDLNAWFFHDHGGMIKWLEDKAFRDSATIWVYVRDAKGYLNAREAFYSVNEETPMGYGFGAYREKREGYISFEEMRLRVLRGESLQNPTIRKEILGH